MKKGGQAWGIDLMFAGIIFFTGVIIFYLYSINYPAEGQNKIEELFFEGEFIADALLSEGLPENWNETNFAIPGIVTENKINETKLALIYNLSNENQNPQGYERVKSAFSTRYDFFFNFSEEITIDSQTISEGGIGKQISPSPENLIKITRITLYKNKPVTLNVFIWE